MKPFVQRLRSRLPGPVLANLIGVMWIGKGGHSCWCLAWPASYSPWASIGKIGLFEEHLEHLCYPPKILPKGVSFAFSTIEVARVTRKLDKLTACIGLHDLLLPQNALLRKSSIFACISQGI